MFATSWRDLLSGCDVVACGDAATTRALCAALRSSPYVSGTPRVVDGATGARVIPEAGFRCPEDLTPSERALWCP